LEIFLSALTSHPVAGAPPRPWRRATPPLEPGDRLSREEFLRRYEALPEHIKVERIEGIVHMPPAAVSADFHGVPHGHLMGWLAVYRAQTPGTEIADNTTIQLDLDNDPQPDASLFILPSHGGRIKKDAKGYIVGSPEFIAETSGSSVSYDLGAKLEAYRRNGVREYLVHRVYDGEIDWFILRDGKYQRLNADDEGIYRSEVFPGLWLKAGSLVDGNLADVLDVLRRGTESEEHRAFVRSLAGQAG
jgi:Uma2 family endonuclease